MRGCAHCPRASWRAMRRRAKRPAMAHEIADGVPSDNPGSREIGFAIPERYNCSRVLFDNLARGNADRPALIGPAGSHSYRALCDEAGRWGNGFVSLGLKRGDRI